VEDIEINREILISLLEHTGLNIDCAENGKEALAMFQADPEKYHVVFMDMQMPVMDGLEATRRIRALEAELCSASNAQGFPAETPPKTYRGIPIIAMTANVFKNDIERCLEAGMNDHIGKPIDIDDMFAKLRKVFTPMDTVGKMQKDKEG